MSQQTYYELRVLSSNPQLLSDLAFELGISAIEQINGGFIIRDEGELDAIEFGLKTFAQKANNQSNGFPRYISCNPQSNKISLTDAINSS